MSRPIDTGTEPCLKGFGMRYHVWVSQLRTVDIEVEAATSDDAERQARSRLQYSGREVTWLESATVIKVGLADAPLPRSPKLFEPERQLLPLPRAAEYL